MKPKLIILNGPLGIGKSTLAKKYADEHPLTLLLDIDDVRRNISHWREEDEKSSIISRKIALAMAKENLLLGYSVVVPQIIRQNEFIEQFEQIAKDADADFFEILLLVEKDEAIRRFKERSYAQGYSSGFRPGGLIDTGGREEKLAKMYDEMLETVNFRANTIIIKPKFDRVDETYQLILDRIGS